MEKKANGWKSTKGGENERNGVTLSYRRKNYGVMTRAFKLKKKMDVHCIKNDMHD